MQIVLISHHSVSNHSKFNSAEEGALAIGPPGCNHCSVLWSCDYDSGTWQLVCNYNIVASCSNVIASSNLHCWLLIGKVNEEAGRRLQMAAMAPQDAVTAQDSPNDSK